MTNKKSKIFIVDDDEMLSMMLSDHLLKNSLYEVHCFPTGEDCLENLNLEPDIIILDFNLNSVYPDASNGLKILQEIKKRNKKAMVIMYSSQEQYGIALQTIGKGALEYVIKDKEAFAKIEEIVKNIL